MWYGKVSVILFIFSFSLLFGGYYANTIFHNPVLNPLTTDSINTIIGSFTISPQINSALIFGDFISAYNILTGLFTGSIFNESINIVVANSGFGGTAVKILMALIFDSASLFFALYIISNRSI